MSTIIEPATVNELPPPIEPGHLFWPRSISEIYNITEPEVLDVLRHEPIQRTGANQIYGNSWISYAQTHGIGLRPYGRRCAEGRQAELAAANAPRPEDTSLAATIRRDQAALAAARQEELCCLWEWYGTRLLKADRSEAEKMELAATAAELGITPEQVAADEQIARKAVELANVLAGERVTAEAIMEAKTAYKRVKEENKQREFAAWKAMRAVEGAGDAFGRAHQSLSRLRAQRPQLFDETGRLRREAK